MFFIADLKLNLMSYIFMGVLFIIISIAYFSTLITALITSMFIIFIMGSYFLYLNMVYGEEIKTTTYIWIFIFPVTAYLFGIFSELIADLRSECSNYKNMMKDLVTIDKISAYSNIKKFYLDLEEEISKSKRYNFSLSLMLIKIEHYKEIRATHGLEYANEIIKKLAETINGSVRVEDKRYRLTDELFGLILPNSSQEGTEVLINRLRHNLPRLNIEKREVEVDLKIAALEYDKDIKDSFEYKKRVEEELAYDL